MRSVLGVTFVLAVLGCGSKTRTPQEHAVAIRAMQFVPADVQVSVGDTVVWTNEDIVPHTATASGTFDSQQIASKQQWRYTVTTAGSMPYTCTFHPTMHGTITAR
jgi:plastocyanin